MSRSGLVRGDVEYAEVIDTAQRAAPADVRVEADGGAVITRICARGDEHARRVGGIIAD